MAETRAPPRPSLHRLGDAGLLLRWPGGIDEATNAAVHQLAARLAEHAPPWLQDLVPAYASLALVIDPGASPDALDEAETWLRGRLDASAHDATVAASSDGSVVVIPVCYAAEFGPDLPVLAEASRLSIPELIACHTAPTYRVAMLGFAPGFPYLLGLDPRLAMPRLSTPRTRIAAGSVGIGGAQTGIYPRESPGGWRLLGRTPLSLFDAGRDPPSLLAPGDRVRFTSIGRDQFDGWAP